MPIIDIFNDQIAFFVLVPLSSNVISGGAHPLIFFALKDLVKFIRLPDD